MSDKHDDLEELLEDLDPAECGYDEWLAVGMGLKSAGYDCEAWEAWSARDADRYHDGECAYKWETFDEGGTVTGATVAHICKEHGVDVSRGGAGDALDWDGLTAVNAYGDADDYGDKGGAVEADNTPILDPDTIAPRTVETAEWNPAENLKTFLRSMFRPEEHVGYTLDCYIPEGEDKPKPVGCTADRTCAELIEELDREGDIRNVIGDPDPVAGAWICVNPTDGRGRQKENITAYRHTLIESDTMPLEAQYGIVTALNLPVAAIVTSGRKSLHCIVRVDARNGKEYDERVRKIKHELTAAGYDIDNATKDVSRLCRMPGMMRGDAKQELVTTDIGAASYDEWADWLEGERDDLPADITWTDDFNTPAELAPVIIGTEEHPLLRERQKLLVTGDSKGHKTTTVMDMAEAIATGGTWLGYVCAEPSKVLYVDLETDPAEFKRRAQDIWRDRDDEGVNNTDLYQMTQNLHIWPMKGHAMPLAKLAPKLIRRVKHIGDVRVIIIDPIYKVMGNGDESDMATVTKFCNALDAIVVATGCSIIYTHHHTKGASGGKKTLDRGSGSGVFGRDTDALLDITELEIPQKERADRGIEDVDVVRMETVLRYAKSPAPLDLEFHYPRFRVSGAYSNFLMVGEDPHAKANERRTARAAAKQGIILAQLQHALLDCERKNVPSTKQNVLSALHANGHHEVTLNQLNYWTSNACQGWCSLRSVQINGTWQLVDVSTELDD